MNIIKKLKKPHSGNRLLSRLKIKSKRTSDFPMSFLFVSLDKICQLCLHCRNLLICRFRGPCHIDAVTLASGNQVDMKMEHCLSGNGAVILQDIHIGEAKHFLHGSCQLYRQCIRSTCLRRVDFKDIWHMVFGRISACPRRKEICPELP